MCSSLKQVHTRFRAYQLGSAGSSFSYFAGNKFTLIEARVTHISRPQLLAELQACGRNTIDTLHITSWDSDHCNEGDLAWVLRNLTPTHIEYPGYDPHTDCGDNCLALIQSYRQSRRTRGYAATVQKVDPPYINGLERAQAYGYADIVYHPKQFFENSNDNSTVKLFRSGAFNVLSLGDVEDASIGSILRRCTTLCREVDVMILAHHGADNGFTTKRLLKELAPKLAVCSSNYDNQFDHPRQEIRDLLWEQGIPLFTTKTGDIVMQSCGGHTMDFLVTNLVANSTKISSERIFRSRKSELLRLNKDTVRAVMHPGWRRPG